MSVAASAKTVSTNAAGTPADDWVTASFTSTKNVVLLESWADNLVAGDNNASGDIFLKDLSTGAVTRISTTSAGAQANGSSYSGELYNNRLLFKSDSTNLAATSVSGHEGLYYKDLATGTVVEVDSSTNGVQGNGGYFNFADFLKLTPTKIIFETNATNLSGNASASPFVTDIFIKNTATGALTLVSSNSNGTAGDGSSDLKAISADETRVIFDSTSTNLVANDSNSTPDLFVKNLTTGATTLVSGTAANVVANDASYFEYLSSDGTQVWFTSNATNLTTGNAAGNQEIYIKNIVTGALTLVSSAANGTAGNDWSFVEQVSSDGGKALVSSYASNLVTGDTNNDLDLFLKTPATGAITAVSSTSAGVLGNGGATPVEASADLGKVVFFSSSTNLAASDNNGSDDLFLKNTVTGALTLISGNSAGQTANVSAIAGEGIFFPTDFYNTPRSVEYDGATPDFSKVFFETTATNLVAANTGGNREVYVKDVGTGALSLVSSSAAGVAGNGKSSFYAVSADGTKAVFESGATNLVAGDNNGNYDLFIKDLTTGAITRITNMPVPIAGDATTLSLDEILAFSVQFADNDTKVLFTTDMLFQTPHSNGSYDVHEVGVYDVITGTTTIVASGGDFLTDSGTVNNLEEYDITAVSSDGTQMMVQSSTSGWVENPDGSINYPDTNAYVFSLTPAFTGGPENNVYNVSDPATTITEPVNGGVDTVFSTVSYTLPANVENMVLQGSANIDGAGNDIDNYLQGNSGNNVLEGMGGNDGLWGGAGSDTAAYTQAVFAVAVDLRLQDQWQNTFGAGNDYLDSIENLIGSSHDDILTGNSGDNVINGGDGNDIIDGVSGRDTLIGGIGNDRLIGGIGTPTLIGGVGNDDYYVSDLSTIIIENLNEGTDSVYATQSYVLSANVENLVLQGINGINATGNDLDNYLQGNSGDNALEGGGGNDGLHGGAGSDTAAYTQAIFAVAVDLRLQDQWQNTFGAGNDYLSSIENLWGSSHDDILTGNASDNTIAGGDGNDIIDGQGGSDMLFGQIGNDRLIGGSDGLTIMFGGTGNDDYYVNSTGTTVYESQGEGTDTVYSTVSYTMPINVENLVLLDAGGNINATGSINDDYLRGNSGNNILGGGMGNDGLWGGAGNDTAAYTTAFYAVAVDLNLQDQWQNTFGAGNDYLDSIENLTGSAQDDILKGDGNANILTGGQGNDTLTGGLGADTFVFAAAGVKNGDDYIADFASGTDKLAFNHVDYGFAAGHTLALDELVLGGTATAAHGQFLFDASTHSLYWDSDGNGATAAVKLATLDHVDTLAVSDFILM